MKKPIHKHPLAWITIVLAVSATLLYAKPWEKKNTQKQSNLLTNEAQQGTFVVGVTVDGKIEAERQTTISNNLSRSAVIKWVVPEGTYVKKGDKLIELESIELDNVIKSLEEKVASDKLLLDEAKENISLTKDEQEHNVKKAQHRVTEAEKNIERYKEGEAPQKKKELKGRIAILERDLVLARQKLEFKKKTNNDPSLKAPPYSQNEIKADSLKVQRLELDLDKAKSNLEMHKKYDHPQKIIKLQNVLIDAKMNLKRAKGSQTRRNLLAKSKYTTKKRIYKDRVAKLKERQEEAKLCTVLSDVTGKVNYDTGGRSWRSNNVEVEIGSKIASRQQLMVIPDLSNLIIKIGVHEAQYALVKKGQKATIKAASIPGVIFTGKVKNIANVSTRMHWSKPGVRTYDITIELDKDHPRINELRHSGSATVSVELYKSEGRIFIPTTAVYNRKTKTFCRKIVNGQPIEVPIKTGKRNDTHVELLPRSNDAKDIGISAGDKVVMLTPENLDSTTKDGETSQKVKTKPSSAKGKGKSKGKTTGKRPKRSKGGKPRRPRK